IGGGDHPRTNAPAPPGGAPAQNGGGAGPRGGPPPPSRPPALGGPPAPRGGPPLRWGRGRPPRPPPAARWRRGGGGRGGGAGRGHGGIGHVRLVRLHVVQVGEEAAVAVVAGPAQEALVHRGGARPLRPVPVGTQHDEAFEAP